MSTNTRWKSLVHSNNAKTFVLPPGWDSRETVAKQLDCTPESVSRLLAPAIKARAVEMKQFPVWDQMVKRVVRTTAYREIPAKT